MGDFIIIYIKNNEDKPEDNELAYDSIKCFASGYLKVPLSKDLCKKTWSLEMWPYVMSSRALDFSQG